MGMDADAYLYYGVNLGESDYMTDEQQELFEEIEEADDWKDVFAEKMGIENPWNDLPEGADKQQFDDWMRSPEFREASTQYRNELDKALDIFGCILDYGGTSEYRKWYVAIKDSIVWSHDFMPQRVDTTSPLTIWDYNLEEFMKKMGIVPKEFEPGWWVIAHLSF